MKYKFIHFFIIFSLIYALPYQICEAKNSKKTPPSPIYTGKRSLNAIENSAIPTKALDMQSAVKRALQFNPSLGAAEAKSKGSEEGRKSSRGAFGPKLGTSYTIIKQERDSTPATMKPADLGTYTWAMEVSQTIFQGFKILSNYQKAALQADSDKAALKNSELSMTEQVQTHFLNYLRSEENVKSQRDALARLRDQLKITQAFYDVGLRPRLDVLQAEVNVSQSENTLIQLENNRDTYLSMLNTLLGFPATAKIKYAGTLKFIPFERTLEQCLETAYRQRPDLYIAYKAIEIAEKDQKIVQGDYYPRIEAYYNVNQTGNSLDLQQKGDRGSRTQTWEVGARATWDIFQWGTTYYADKQAGWQVTRLRYEEENLKLNVGYDIKSKLLNVHEAKKRINVAEKEVEQATEAYNVALARYQEQVGTNFDVLDASSNLRTAQASLTSAKADYLTALSQIYIAMGEFHPDLVQH